MNWTLALPEIVLACTGMGILVFGVLQRGESFTTCSMKGSSPWSAPSFSLESLTAL